MHQQALWPTRGGRGCWGRAPLALTLLMAVTVAGVSTGCTSGDDATASVVGASSTDPAARSGLPGGELTEPVAPESADRTPRQRSFLDALAAAGVQRSSDLRALSIGSYVCQARAAGQDDPAVWEFVLPLVRGDVDEAVDAGPRPLSMSVHDATAQYIRIAIEQLC